MSLSTRAVVGAAGCWAALLLLGVAACAVPAPAAVEPAAGGTVGRGAPAFPELQRAGGPVVVNFFATWCGPCEQEMPMLVKRADRSEGRFVVLGVDTQDDPSRVQAFARRMGIRFPIRHDSDGRLARAYGVEGLPATFFVDTRHVVRARVLGPLTPDSLEVGLRRAGTG